MRTLIILLFLALSLHSSASPVDMATAEKVSYAFMKQKKGWNENYVINERINLKESGHTAAWGFNFSGGGWTIVAADDAFRPILAYSLQGRYDTTAVSPQERYWIQQYLKGIGNKLRSGSPDERHPEWNAWLGGNITKATKEVLPLCTTRWNQGCYYNEMCPYDTAGPCDHAVTGCVATAMAQVIKRWNYPVRGNGYHEYQHPVYGTISADFGAAVYDWSVMPDSLGNSCLPTAELLFHCGVSCNMDYGPGESGGALMASAFENYFRYSLNAHNVYKYLFSEADWIAMLKKEIDEGRPVLYAGYPNLGIPAPGHAWVVDGYDNNDYFHFNWGWGYTGTYYTMGGFFYSANNEAVIGIMPVASNDIKMLDMPSPVPMTFHVPHPVSIRVANHDTLAISNIPVCYMIDGTTLVRDTIFGTLAPSADTLFQFSQYYNFPAQPGHIFEIKVFSELASDAYKGNDTLTFQIENVPCTPPVYTMGFEPGENMNGWFTEDINHDGGWNRANNNGNFGIYCMNINSLNVVNNDYFFSRCLELEAGKVYKVTFYYKAFADWTHENIGLYIGDSCSSVAMTQHIGSLYGFNNTTWQMAEFYFNVPANDWYYLGWHCYSGTDGLVAFVDDIEITEQTATDAAITRWHSSQGGCDLGDVPVTVTVRNLCSQTFTDIPVAYTLNGGSPVTEIINGNLLPGDSAIHTFATQIPMYSTGDYHLKIYVEYPGDVNAANDTLAITIHNVVGSVAPYSMGFESSEDYSHWISEDLNNDNHKWKHWAIGGYNNSSCMRYDYSSFVAADDWLISDCFNLSSSEVYRLGFRYKIEDASWPENFSVHMGTQPTHTAMNVLLSDMPGLINPVYQQSFIDFTVPADTLYYFGFYCYSDALMFNLYLDDITLDIVTHSGKQDIKPLFISLHPNPAHDIVTVYLSGSEKGLASYSIVNSEGITLKNGLLNENENMIDISDLPSGIYYLKVTTNHKTTVKKIGKL